MIRKQIIILVSIFFSYSNLPAQVLLQTIDDAHVGNVITLDTDATGSLVISP